MIIIIILFSYLIGSIPTSIITGKILKGIDIREHGSGNAGGTNTFRVLGWKAGVFVSIIDVFKGFAVVFWIARLAFGTIAIDLETIQLIVGFSAVAGHVWTVFAGFRGGKGVGTGAGMLLGLYPFAVLICAVVFLVIFLFTRIVSLASISASISLPVVLSLFRYGLDWPVADSLYYFGFLTAAFIVFTHRSNIKRLINGTENSFRKSKAPQP